MEQESLPPEENIESGLLFRLVFGTVFLLVVFGITFGVMKAAFYIGGF